MSYLVNPYMVAAAGGGSIVEASCAGSSAYDGLTDLGRQKWSQTYDGSVWTLDASMSGDARSEIGTGAGDSSTGGLYAVTGLVNGGDSADVDYFDGTSWAVGAAYPQGDGRSMFQGGAGNWVDGGLNWGGRSGGYNAVDKTYSYDSNAWTAENDLTTSRQYTASGGVQNDAISATGYSSSWGSDGNNAQVYDGTDWGNITNCNLDTYAASGCGSSSTDLLIVKGRQGVAADNETTAWDGSSWALQNDAPVTCWGGGQGGNSSVAILNGGDNAEGGQDFTQLYDGSSWTDEGQIMDYGNNLMASTGLIG